MSRILVTISYSPNNASIRFFDSSKDESPEDINRFLIKNINDRIAIETIINGIRLSKRPLCYAVTIGGEIISAEKIN